LESLKNQLIELIVDPLEATNISMLIIIDALNECKDDEPASAILALLAQYINCIPKIKWFVTGQPEAPIRSGFCDPGLQSLTQISILHNVIAVEMEQCDIKLYFHTSSV